VNTDGDTALSLAQKQGHREIVTILRGYGAWIYFDFFLQLRWFWCLWNHVGNSFVIVNYFTLSNYWFNHYVILLYALYLFTILVIPMLVCM
jgi:hypothetical protein